VRHIILDLIDILSSTQRPLFIKELKEILPDSEKTIRTNLALIEHSAKDQKLFNFNKIAVGKFFTYSMTKVENIEVDFLYYKSWSEKLEDSRKSDIIIDAIRHRNFISFEYTGQERDRKKYEDVEPYKIANYDGLFYLIGKHNSIIKKFYLQEIRADVNHINRVFESDERVEKVLNDSTNIWFDDSTKLFKVILKIREELREHFISRKPINHLQKEIKKEEKESEFFRLEIQITHKKEILPLVKSFLPLIQIEEPQNLKEELMKDITEFLT